MTWDFRTWFDTSNWSAAFYGDEEVGPVNKILTTKGIIVNNTGYKKLEFDIEDALQFRTSVACTINNWRVAFDDLIIATYFQRVHLNSGDSVTFSLDQNYELLVEQQKKAFLKMSSKTVVYFVGLTRLSFWY